MIQAFEARGKLMLTGEYFVLDGASSLALPTVYGQSMTVETTDAGQLHWMSIDKDGVCWFEAQLPLSLALDGVTNPVALKLLEMLKVIKHLNPLFLDTGVKVTVTSSFDLQWGLGSSSTLVSLLAQWAQVDPYVLQFECFGGSGYDIACATAKGPILYEKLPTPSFRDVSFHPLFTGQLYFVYLGQKQNSRDGIKYYRSLNAAGKSEAIEELNDISHALLEKPDFEAFCQLLQRHEKVVGEALKTQPVQQQMFADFNGAVKSLGAWGGDFVLAASSMNEGETEAYFKEKGHDVVIPYGKMVL